MATLIAYRLSEKRGISVKTAILTMELLLLTTGINSTFFMLKKAISPRYLFNMALVNLSEILNYLKSFLSSPFYICLFINSVVILILTFSKFNHSTTCLLNVFPDVDHDGIQIQPQEEDNTPKRTRSVIAMDAVMSFFSRYNSDTVLVEDEIPCSVKDIEIDCVTKFSFQNTEAGEIVSPQPSNPPHETTTSTNYYQEEGELEDDDSLNATWKAITGGGNNNNNNKLLKKSETWPMDPVSSAQSIGSKDLLPSAAAAWKELRKSVTFNDALSVFRRGGLRGDFSVSAEESNKRFDDFIKKTNRQRMLQRQESHQQALNRAR